MIENIALVGIPNDENSSFMRGSALAPAIIRKTLHNGSANLSSETGIDIANNPHFNDLGDLTIGEGAEEFMKIEQHISYIMEQDYRILSLGGDHAITYPILRAHGKKYHNINILHFDAHPDLYDEYEGNRLAHGCPFARIMEENLATRLIQVGIRTLNDHQRKQAARFGVEIIEMKDFTLNFNPTFDGPVYISFDMDSLDPAFAPGVSHHEPGGLSSREAITIIQNINTPIIGADVVEYNPRRDIHDMTAMMAAKLVKEIAGKMITDCQAEKSNY